MSQEKVISKLFEVDEYDEGYGRVVHREYEVYAEPLDDKVLKYVRVTKRTYYMWPKAGNYYSNIIVIRLDNDGKPEIHRYTVGSSNITHKAYIKLDDFSGETPGFLWLEEVKHIKTLEDLKKYVKDMIEWVKDLVDTLSL
jgi:hypothetical protein